MLDLLVRWLLLPWVACLPMRWHGKLLQCIGWLPTMKRESLLAWQSACLRLPPSEISRADFLKRWRLVAWHDVLDAYAVLVRRRPNHHVFSVSGAWPDPECTPNFIAVSSHWGAGLWSLWHLRQQGWQVSFVLEKIALEVLPVRQRWAAKVRLACVRSLGVSLIVTGGAFARLSKVLQTPRSVVVLLIDAPRLSSHTQTVSLWQASLSWPAAWQALASVGAHGTSPLIPVVPFVVAVPPTGGRKLCIGAASLPNAAAPWLVQQMSFDPAAWHLWSAWTNH